MSKSTAVNAVLKVHQASKDQAWVHCVECQTDWPCDPIRLCREVEFWHNKAKSWQQLAVALNT